MRIHTELFEPIIGQTKMSVLFTKSRINGLVLKNRLVRSATYEAFADLKGCATPELTKCYTDLADGDIGLLISSCTQIDTRGQHHPTMLSLVSEEAQQSMGLLAHTLHKHGAPLCVQIVHSGAGSKPELTGFPSETPMTLSKSDIDRVIANFVSGAKACSGAGVDSVQIHAAGGFLLGALLNPATNQRTDEFGGNQKNRNEILRRIIEGIRAVVPTSYPVQVKFSAGKGTEIENVVETAKMCENAGIDAIELTLGIETLGPKYLDAVKAARKAVKVPIMLCGGFITKKEMEEAIESGICDYISLSRPLIREPNLVKLFKDGKSDTAKCANCNGCLKWTSFDEKPLKCVKW